MFLYALICVVLLIFIYVFSYGTRNFEYWQKKGVVHEKPIPIFGTIARVLLKKTSITEYLWEVYNKYPKERFVGIYLANDRALLLRDPELVKNVLVSDFHHFHYRGLNPHREYVEPLMKNLFAIEGDDWKLLRQTMTPAFTSGKLKAMFPLIVERAEKLQKLAACAAETGEEVDIKDLIARYTTDFIGACGFGIDSDSLNDENSCFRKFGKRLNEVKFEDACRMSLKQIAPELFKYMHLFSSEIENASIKILKGVMKERDYKPCGRNDFIDQMLELKDKGKIVGESIDRRNPDGTPKSVELVMDDMLIIAQAFVFFAAGFETSSSSSGFTMHQLAYHPEEQKKCQKEIDEVLLRHGGKLSYDAVKEMKYLEMCFKESMRIFPTVGFLSRKCANKYTIPGSDVTIDEGVFVNICVHAMQMDERFFPEPEKFKPDRFHPDNANAMAKHVFLPFGEGPRACIGERLGLMQSIAGLAAILSQFSVAPSKSTVRHPVVHPTSFIVQNMKDGLPLALTARC